MKEKQKETENDYTSNRSYSGTSNASGTITSITIDSTCVITDIVNKCKNKDDLINELKSFLNKDLKNPTHNFVINIKDEEGKNISEFYIQFDDDYGLGDFIEEIWIARRLCNFRY